MPARETDRLEPTTETAAEVTAPQPEAAQTTTFSGEGELPAVATAGAATGATASELAFGGNDLAQLDRGIHDWEAYKATCERAGKPEKWQESYRAGHTEAKGWIQPYEHRRMFEWELKKGTSASKAVQDFLKGPTIADYRVAGVADELDELRDEFGDQKFDRLFGSANEGADAKIPKAQRLRISAGLYTIPMVDQMKQIAREADEAADRPPEDAVPALKLEARTEERKPVEQDQEPAVIAQELGIQQDRERV